MTSKIYRTAGSIKNGTVAAASYAGSTLAYVAPHMAGAIDILVVEQPDGTLKSSPFYVRFGKYTGIRSTDRRVHITVNDVQADVTMHLGRSGEAYFVGEDELEGDSEDEDLPRVLATPNGYPSAAQVAAAQLDPEHSIDLHAATVAEAAAEATPTLRPSHSTSALASIIPDDSCMDTSLSAPPGDPTMTLPDLLTPGTSANLSSTQARLTSSSSSTGSNTALDAGQLSSVSSSGALARPLKPESGSGSVHSLLTKSLAAVKQQDDDRQASHAHASSSHQDADTTSASKLSPDSPTTSQSAFLCVSTRAEASEQQDMAFKGLPEPTTGSASHSQQNEGLDRLQSKLLSPFSDSGARYAVPGSDIASRASMHGSRNGPTETMPGNGNKSASGQAQDTMPGNGSEKDSGQARDATLGKGIGTGQGSGQATDTMPGNGSEEEEEQDGKQQGSDLQQLLVNSGLHVSAAAAEIRDSILSTISPERVSGPGPVDEAPAHPWSVSNPRFLGTPAASQPTTVTMSAAAAAAPVGQGSAAGNGPAAIGISPHKPEHMSIGQSPAELSTAIPALLPESNDAEDGSPHAGNRVELEALHDQLYRQGQTAQVAMYEAHKGRLDWDQGQGEPPIHSQYGKEVAITADLAAALAAGQGISDPSSSTHTSTHKSPLTQPHEAGSESPPASKLSSYDATAHPEAELTNQDAAAGLLLPGKLPRAVEPGLVNRPRPSSPQLQKPPRSALLRQRSQSVPTSPTSPSRVTFQHPNSSNPTARSPFEDAARCAGQGTYNSPGLSAHKAAQQNTSRSSALSPDTPDASRGQAGLPSSSVSIPGRDSAHWRSPFRQTSSSVTGSSPEGMSPPDGYLADSERFPSARSPSPGINAGPLAGLELSLCGPLLKPDTSAEEAYQHFVTHRITRAQFAEQGPKLAASPDLMCRLGHKLYTWHQIAPAVMGLLAFGGDWQHLLPLQAGVALAVPASEARQMQQEARKVKVAKSSSWRGWLGSWRSGSGGQGEGGSKAEGQANTASIDAAVAALATAHQSADTKQPLSVEALQSQLSPTASNRVSQLVATQQQRPDPHRRRSFAPSPEQLRDMDLQPGQNNIDFSFAGQRLRAYIYCCSWNSRLVISDIDGTITKSDLLGHLLPRVGFDWSHRGVTRLFTNIKANGYVFMFLSSRAIAQASATRDYLHTLNQDGETLPAGPVIISPDGLFPSLYRELVLRRPHEFKIRCLQDIRALFPADWNPFYAGFGNRDTDEISYLTVGVPASKCFIINPQGELRKASSAVATSTWQSLSSINGIVQAMFPPLKEAQPNAALEREEYNDYNYWHVTPPIIIDSEDDAFGDPEGLHSEEDSVYDDDDDDVKLFF